MKARLLLTILFAGCTIFVTAQSVLNLHDCLKTGLEQNYGLRIVRNSEQMSRNEASIGNLGLLPTLSVSADASGEGHNGKYNYSDENKPDAKDVQNWYPSALGKISLDWSFSGYSFFVDRDIAKHGVRESEMTTKQSVENFIAQLTAEYYAYIYQQMLLSNRRHAVALSKERLRIAEARYTIGSFSRLDLQQARVDFNADSSAYMSQQENVINSRIRIHEMMGAKDMNAPLPVADTLINFRTDLAYDDLLQRSLTVNTDLLLAELKQKGAVLSKKQVLASIYPALNFGANFNVGSNINRDYMYNEGAYRVSVGLRFNIFDGKMRTRLKNAQLGVKTAQLQRQDAELTLQAQVASDWHAYRNNLELWKLEQENVVVARDNYATAMERYMIGDLSGVEMRDAQLSLLDAEGRLIQVAFNTKSNEISLLLLSGQVEQYLQ